MARTPRTTTDPVDPNVVDNDDPTIQGQDQSENDDSGSTQTDNDDEQQEPEADDGVAVPSEEALDAIDALEAGQAVKENSDVAASEQKLLEIAAAYPLTTGNDHTVFGFSGRTFNLGDLRNVASGIRDKYRG